MYPVEYFVEYTLVFFIFSDVIRFLGHLIEKFGEFNI